MDLRPIAVQMPLKLKRMISLNVCVLNVLNVNVFILSLRDMDKQKNNLLDAYVRKTIALGKINLIESKQSEIDSPKKPTAVADDIDAIYAEVGKFTDYTDQKVKLNF